MSLYDALPTLPQLPDIPAPVVPVRPTQQSDAITGTYNGQPVTITRSGMYDSNGKLVSGVAGGNNSAPAVSSNPSSNEPSIWQNIKDNWKDILGASVGQMTGNNPASVTWGVEHPLGATTNLLSSRWVILLIGLMLIGAGLMQFKATQVVIETGTKVAKAVTA